MGVSGCICWLFGVSAANWALGGCCRASLAMRGPAGSCPAGTVPCHRASGTGRAQRAASALPRSPRRRKIRLLVNNGSRASAQQLGVQSSPSLRGYCHCHCQRSCRSGQKTTLWFHLCLQRNETQTAWFGPKTAETCRPEAEMGPDCCWGGVRRSLCGSFASKLRPFRAFSL